MVFLMNVLKRALQEYITASLIGSLLSFHLVTFPLLAFINITLCFRINGLVRVLLKTKARLRNIVMEETMRRDIIKMKTGISRQIPLQHQE